LGHDTAFAASVNGKLWAGAILKGNAKEEEPQEGDTKPPRT